MLSVHYRIFLSGRGQVVATDIDSGFGIQVACNLCIQCGIGRRIFRKSEWLRIGGGIRYSLFPYNIQRSIKTPESAFFIFGSAVGDICKPTVFGHKRDFFSSGKIIGFHIIIFIGNSYVKIPDGNKVPLCLEGVGKGFSIKIIKNNFLCRLVQIGNYLVLEIGSEKIGNY